MNNCEMCKEIFNQEESGLPDICHKCEKEMDEEFAEEMNDFSEDVE